MSSDVLTTATPMVAEARAEWWRPAPSPAASAPEAATSTTRGKLAFASFLTFTLVMMLAPQQFFPFLGTLRIAFVSAGVAAAAHVYRCSSEGVPLLKAGPALYLALALACWAVATTPFSLWPGGSVAMLLGIFFKSLIVFWLGASVLDTPDRLRKACLALVLLAIPLSLTGLHNLATQTYTDGPDGNHRIAGYDAPLTENPNDLALMLNLIIPLAVGLCLSTKSALGRAALLLLIGLHAATVIATFSRGGFVTLALVVAIYALKFFRRGAFGVLLSGVLLLVLAMPLLPDNYAARLATVFDVSSDPTGSAQARTEDLGLAMEFAFDHPLVGAGAGQNILALNSLRGSTWREVHSVYLQYAMDLGLPGLLLFLSLLATCYFGARSAVRRAAATAGGSGLARMVEGIEVSLVAFAVAAFFHPVGYHFYFFFIAGLAAAARTLTRERGPAPE